jgi:hypothetical protein
MRYMSFIQVNDIYYENMTLEKTDILVDSLRKGIMPEPVIPLIMV